MTRGPLTKMGLRFVVQYTSMASSNVRPPGWLIPLLHPQGGSPGNAQSERAIEQTRHAAVSKAAPRNDVEASLQNDVGHVEVVGSSCLTEQRLLAFATCARPSRGCPCVCAAHATVTTPPRDRTQCSAATLTVAPSTRTSRGLHLVHARPHPRRLLSIKRVCWAHEADEEYCGRQLESARADAGPSAVEY